MTTENPLEKIHFLAFLIFLKKKKEQLCRINVASVPLLFFLTICVFVREKDNVLADR